MNTKLIIASLVVCSSSAVLADPGPSRADGYDADGTADCVHSAEEARFGDEDARGIDDRFDRSDVSDAPIQSIYRREGWYGGGWNGEGMARPVTLASGASFANQGRKFITVGARAGRFGTLQIRAEGGQTFIKQVYVQFADGQEQVIRDLDRTLVGDQGVAIDLDGGRRAIRRIVVYGSSLDGRWRNTSDNPHGDYDRRYDERSSRSPYRHNRGGSFTVTGA